VLFRSSASRRNIFTTCARIWRAAATASPRGLERIGFPVLRAQGTYFLTVDLSPLGLNETDEAFCRRIVTDYKVAAIPVSAFYEKDAVTSVVRFCFAKKDATLDTALERLSDAVHRR
jgi:N-succinyldiaminopimelate aminotransferase